MQYYIRSQSSKFGIYEPVDIGWRWRKDEFPKERALYYMPCALSNGKKCWCSYNDGQFYGLSGIFMEVVQWYKMEEPWKEAEDEN